MPKTVKLLGLKTLLCTKNNQWKISTLLPLISKISVCFICRLKFKSSLCFFQILSPVLVFPRWLRLAIWKRFFFSSSHLRKLCPPRNFSPKVRAKLETKGKLLRQFFETLNIHWRIGINIFSQYQYSLLDKEFFSRSKRDLSTVIWLFIFDQPYEQKINNRK